MSQEDSVGAPGSTGELVTKTGQGSMPKESEGDQMSLLMCSCGCGSMPWGARAITLNLDRVAGETRQYPGTEETGLREEGTL